jgi:mono/diheme cytochrome c family protein
MRTTTLALVTSILVLAACTKPEEKKQTQSPEAARADLVKVGEKLVTIGGCNDCHSPVQFDPKLGHPVPIPGRTLSGHPEGAPDPVGEPGKGDNAVMGPTMTSFRLPFGTVYSQNLTPDKETGIGNWTEAQFKAAVRTGKHQGAANGRPILPPMPWQNLAHASDEDLSAIFAYLQSITPVKNAVPAPKVPPPVLEALGKQS